MVEYCSFCEKILERIGITRDSRAFICDECIVLAIRILADEGCAAELKKLFDDAPILLAKAKSVDAARRLAAAKKMLEEINARYQSQLPQIVATEASIMATRSAFEASGNLAKDALEVARKASEEADAQLRKLQGENKTTD